jgi:hypothetical protein
LQKIFLSQNTLSQKKLVTTIFVTTFKNNSVTKFLSQKKIVTTYIEYIDEKKQIEKKYSEPCRVEAMQ